MKTTDSRNLFSSLIGASATSTDIQTIPATQATTGDGRASIALGFPPETFIARAAGGNPPYGSDMNGFLNLLSSAMQVLQAGYLGPFDATFAAGIGGYPAGAIVSGSTAGTFWVSKADSNTTVPGATGATWQSLFNGYATEAWAESLFATIAQLQAEASARASADATLQSNIASEASARASADTAIQGSLSQETAARIAADELNAKLSGGNSFTGDQAVTGNARIWSSAYPGETLISTGNGLSWIEHLSTRGGAVDAYIALAPSVIATHLGNLAMTSQLPTAGTITNGTYTKTPMNDGTGRSILVQSFSVTLTGPTSVLTFPMAYSSAPTSIAYTCSMEEAGSGFGVYLNYALSSGSPILSGTSVTFHHGTGSGTSNVATFCTFTISGIVS